MSDIVTVPDALCRALESIGCSNITALNGPRVIGVTGLPEDGRTAIISINKILKTLVFERIIAIVSEGPALITIIVLMNRAQFIAKLINGVPEPDPGSSSIRFVCCDHFCHMNRPLEGKGEIYAALPRLLEELDNAA